MPDPIHVVLVDDHNVVRQALRVLLNQQQAIQVIADTATGIDARRVVARTRPDVILLDVTLPNTAPHVFIPDLRRSSPHSKILVLSAFSSPEHVYHALDAGIDGYMLKQADAALLFTAIERVAAGETFFHPTIQKIIAARDAAPTTSFNSNGKHNDMGLTQRQLEVLQLIAIAATNRDIAETLIVSEETIRTHIKTIYRKLRVSSRSQAVFKAIRLGLIDVEVPEG